MFITFEGINGSGKSTQVKLLHKYFLENGKTSILTKGIGGGGEFCMEIRRILCTTKSIDNLTELFLLYASRNEHVKNVLLPAIQEGKHIVCDRYVDSSYAYQCNGDAKMVELLKIFHKAIKAPIPDITFFIDIPVSVSEARLAPLVYDAMVQGAGYKKYDEIKTEDMQKIVNNYKKLADLFPDRIYRIDGTKSIKDIHNEIVNIIEAKLTSN